MPVTRRYVIICEGESEWAYLQRFQSFLDRQALPEKGYLSPFILINPYGAIAKSGRYGTLERKFKDYRKHNRNVSIKVWADFDLYHRNDNSCSDQYRRKTAGIPDFHFSFHNFEDFFALHYDGEKFAEWLRFGADRHFNSPRHSRDYLPDFRKIFPTYAKGDLPADFVNWDSLYNLKHNRSHQPRSNPHGLQGVLKFTDFLISEIERAYPGKLSQT